jgi:GT2 family glycosyltransferase
MGEHVTIGVPVYRGELFVEETLRSIQNQTYKDFDVIMSVDGPDPVCEDSCSSFLNDSRFTLAVQPERLGWVGNINWLMSQVTGDFWYYHQQDDLTAETYVEVLIEYARRNPATALVYCDLVPFGRIEGLFPQVPSVMGATAFIRQMTFLHEQYPAFAFRGLTRANALRKAGGIPTNDCENFGVDITWLAAVALSGELHHVPMQLYRKRYHSNNTDSKWWTWGKEMRLKAWTCHCADMLGQALRVEGTAQEMRLLWLAAIERLTSPQAAGYFLPVAELTKAERTRMFDSFIDRVRASAVHNIPVLLDADWGQIDQWSRGFYWLPSGAPVEIIGFGPNPITRGEPYNTQPDGSSAIWVRTSRRAAPGSRIRLAGTVLDTVLTGTVLTALVPAPLTKQVGTLELVLVGPDRSPWSQPVTLEIRDASSA